MHLHGRHTPPVHRVGAHGWWRRRSGRWGWRAHPSHFIHQAPFVVAVVLASPEEEPVPGVAVVRPACVLLGLGSCTGDVLGELVYQGAVIGV